MTNNPFEDDTPDRSLLHKVFEFFKGFRLGSVFKFKKARWDDVAEFAPGTFRSGSAFIACLIVFIVWALVSGYILYSRAEYLFIRFAEYAYNTGILSGRLVSTPLTVVVDILIFIGITIMFLTLSAGLYFLLNLIFYRKDPLSAKNNLSFCYMIGVLIAVIEFVIIVATPYNLFM